MTDEEVDELIDFVTHRFFGERISRQALRNAIKDFKAKQKRKLA